MEDVGELHVLDPVDAWECGFGEGVDGLAYLCSDEDLYEGEG